MNFKYQVWQNLNTTPARFIKIEKIRGIDGNHDYKVIAYYQNNIPVTSWIFSGKMVDYYAMNLFANGWSLLENQKEICDEQS